MRNTMHLAAQYLATAAISFTEKKADDSHTNLGWTNHNLVTHPFPNRDKLGLSYENFSLEWIAQNGNKEHFLLDGKTHKDIINWISLTSINNGITKPYSYNLHYEIPNYTIEDSYQFQLAQQNELSQLIKNRDLALDVISNVLQSSSYKSPIRIWPHHFDTGAFFNINENLSIGIGMATPDTLINDFYFYISGYRGHDSVDIINPASHKNYYSDSWKGFALSIKNLNKEAAIDFCKTAINVYKKSMK
ncbi:hypothetical protein [uncultured Winogradskyella sp.]|uniref:hypothetical protein n=1 Tax=uncultured Winogradskyella sp. TaxID=395353 RepID=UPI002625F570|nr:hypothetical protein [uncultured Winogradskyella sp.]